MALALVGLGGGAAAEARPAPAAPAPTGYAPSNGRGRTPGKGRGWRGAGQRDLATAGWNAPLTDEGRVLRRNLRRAICRMRRVLRAEEREACGALVRRDGR